MFHAIVSPCMGCCGFHGVSQQRPVFNPYRSTLDAVLPLFSGDRAPLSVPKDAKHGHRWTGDRAHCNRKSNHQNDGLMPSYTHPPVIDATATDFLHQFPSLENDVKKLHPPPGDRRHCNLEVLPEKFPGTGCYTSGKTPPICEHERHCHCNQG